MPERQVHSVIRRNRRQINPEIETGCPVNHHGEDTSSRADQADISTPYVCGNEQSARSSRRGEPNPLEDVCPFADGGASIPWIAALDHLI